VKYQPLVYSIASEVYKRSAAIRSGLDYDDLVSVANVCLIKCIRDFRVSYNVEFATYAYRRLRGSMLDEVRNFDRIGRSVRRTMAKMGEEPPQIFNMHDNYSGEGLCCFAREPSAIMPSPLSCAASKEFMPTIRRDVPKHGGLVLSLYCTMNYSQDEISKITGYSQTWCSFLLRDSLAALREVYTDRLYREMFF